MSVTSLCWWLYDDEQVTLMLMTGVGEQICWWQVWDVGDRYRMLMTGLMHWKSHQDNEKNRQHHDRSTNISNRSPSQSHQHNDVTNITVTEIFSDGVFGLRSCWWDKLNTKSLGGKFEMSVTIWSIFVTNTRIWSILYESLASFQNWIRMISILKDF